jgi:transcriptional regulator with XRE-family HTH domain
MNLCSKGCGQPAKVRGMCRVHYNHKRKYSYYREQWGRRSAVGTTRRLRALMAIGYPQRQLAEELGSHQSWVSKLMLNDRANVNADTALRVGELYDRLSMTPGPSEETRDRAIRRGWMPPLAWDDETIDDPLAVPNPGHQERVGFTERFLELRELGYNDLQILARWKVKPNSLLRQLMRYDIPASPELANLASSEKHRKSTAS